MTLSLRWPLVAVDIGNSRLKFGLFPQPQADGLPTPSRTLELVPHEGCDPLAAWLKPLFPRELGWAIASVNRTHARSLLDWLSAHGADDSAALVAHGDLPLSIEVPQPERVGMDRLVGALAANRLRSPGHPAIVVDLGSAITVDLVSVEGVFRGGAILPGIAMSARALYEFTDLLPLVEMAGLAEPPPPLGTNTIEALRAGLYWGAVGGVRELVARLSAEQPAEPQVFLTGGAAPSVASLLAPGARWVPELVLSGIALLAGGKT